MGSPMVGPEFVAAAQRAGGASFWHRHSRGAPWEPYTPAQCAQILGAIAQSPVSGRMPLTLGSASFEIRWGDAATSSKMARAEFGMLQVNTRSQNSRDVKPQVGPPEGGAKAVAPAMFRRAPSFVESGFKSRVEYEAALKDGMRGYEDELVPLAPADAASIAHAHWYWQEDASCIGDHHESDVLQPGNFVRYSGTVCAELDAKYAAYTSSGKRDSLRCVPIDLTDRIASTGTEQKARNEHTGVAFTVDFGSMRQTNTQSGYSREVKRDEFETAAPKPAPTAPVGVNVTVNLPPPSRPAIGPIGVDTTGDGVSDSIAVDTTGDGVPDRVVPKPQAAPRLMKVAVPPGLHGGMDMQVQTPSGLVRVPIPAGLTAGQEFEFVM